MVVESNGETEVGEWRKKGEAEAEKRLSQLSRSSKLIVRVSMRRDLSLSVQASRMGQSAWDPWRSIFMLASMCCVSEEPVRFESRLRAGGRK
jgi:hypothetical protein